MLRAPLIRIEEAVKAKVEQLPGMVLCLRSVRHHGANMRTTSTLDPDIAAKAKKGPAKLRKPFKEIINAALRVGLDQILAPPAARPYRTKPRPLGLRQGFS